MALAHFTKWYAVVDAKIAKLTADPAGGTATYGTIIDVPGIKAVEISGNINLAELRGDNQLLDSNSILQDLQVSIEYAKLSLDVLPVVLGGASVDSGTTPNQKVTYTRAGTDSFNYFKLEAKTPTDGVDFVGGDGHILLPKLILSSPPDLGFAEEDYELFSMEARALPLLATGNKWIEIVANETAAAIS
jgi:hypothetical protein